MDGVAPAETPAASPAAPSPAAPAPATVTRMKRMLEGVGGLAYAGYALWLLALMAILPSTEAWAKSLVSLGVLSAAAGAVAFIAIGLIGLQRITKADVSVGTRQRSTIKLVALLVPGLLLSAMAPIAITREPALTLDIVSPERAEDVVAPLAITFSAQRAVDILARDGRRAIRYAWDFEGDGTVNEQNVVPSATAFYQRSGLYTISVRMELDNGETRTVARRFTISQAVFSVSPQQPVIERPVRFSIAHLFTDPKVLAEVQWDYGDGSAVETGTTPETMHTYYARGRYTVSATYRLQNQNLTTVKRQVEVIDPPPLKFPVTLETEPGNLIGPAPFAASFRVITDEPLREVAWSLGDGREERGASIVKLAHSYETPGLYPVSVRVRSASGDLAELNALVRVTEQLQLPDLRFDGSPAVTNNKISGELPLALDLKPVTAQPLIDFRWEVPESVPASVTGSQLRTVLRKEGVYRFTLLAEDAQRKALRQVIEVQVKSPSAQAAIIAQPEGGVAPVRIRFDASNSFIPPGDSIAGFEWRFGDETKNEQPELGAARTEHLYTKPGVYKVSLRIVMASGKAYTAERTIIVRKPTLSACITASRLRTQVGGGVQLNSDCSTGVPVSTLWDVRLASTPQVVQAQSQDPVYVFIPEQPGDYTVSLILKDEWGNESRESLTLTVTP